jgi:hypothetical protein
MLYREVPSTQIYTVENIFWTAHIKNIKGAFLDKEKQLNIASYVFLSYPSLGR